MLKYDFRKDIDIIIQDNNNCLHKYSVCTYSFNERLEAFDLKASMLEKLCNKGIIKNYSVES